MRLVITLSRLFLFLGGILVFALCCKKFSLTLIEPELIAKKIISMADFSITDYVLISIKCKALLSLSVPVLADALECDQ